MATTEEEDVAARIRELLDQLGVGSLPGQLSLEQKDSLVNGLPHIDEKALFDLGEKGTFLRFVQKSHLPPSTSISELEDSACPICFTPYLAIIAEEEMASAMDSPAHPAEHHGVTKLTKSWQCGHMFCRRDISKWITDGHDSCPLCRRLLVEKVEGQERNATGRPDPVPVPVLPTNIEDTMMEIEARLGLSARGGLGRFSLDHLFGAGGLGTASGSQRRDDHDDDRREYSGMYS